jgi:CBS domain protein
MVIIAFGIFAIFLIGLVVLRNKAGNRFEIKNTDVVLALVPVALWLFLTGKIQEFGFGEVKIVAAIKVASKAPIDAQVSKFLPVDAVPLFEKGGSGEITRAVQKKAQALGFHLGRGHYTGSAIRAYLEELTQYPYLRYVVLNNQDDTFFGLVDARQLAEILRSERLQPPSSTPGPSLSGEQAQFAIRPEPRLTSNNLAKWLNEGNAEELKTLPGFIAASDALDSNAKRQKALERLNALNVQTIPVVDETKKFIGVVDRSKLTASILTEIAAQLERPE